MILDNVRRSIGLNIVTRTTSLSDDPVSGDVTINYRFGLEAVTVADPAAGGKSRIKAFIQFDYTAI